MSRLISEIWIILIFEQSLRKSTVWLVDPYQSCSVGKLTGPDLETGGRGGGFNPASLEDTYQRLRVFRWFDHESEKLAGPTRAYSFLSNRVEATKPLLAICGSVVQQEECGRSHGLRDVAQPPFATTPQRPELRRLLLRIVTFTRTQLVELQRHWRSDSG